MGLNISKFKLAAYGQVYRAAVGAEQDKKEFEGLPDQLKIRRLNDVRVLVAAPLRAKIDYLHQQDRAGIESTLPYYCLATFVCRLVTGRKLDLDRVSGWSAYSERQFEKIAQRQPPTRLERFQEKLARYQN